MHAHPHGAGARLEHRDDALRADAPPQAVDGGGDRGRVMREIVVDADAGRRAAQFHAPAHALEARQRRAARSTGTPAWRAAQIAASALSTLCAPSSSQRTSATGVPAMQ